MKNYRNIGKLDGGMSNLKIWKSRMQISKDREIRIKIYFYSYHSLGSVQCAKTAATENATFVWQYYFFDIISKLMYILILIGAGYDYYQSFIYILIISLRVQ